MQACACSCMALICSLTERPLLTAFTVVVVAPATVVAAAVVLAAVLPVVVGEAVVVAGGSVMGRPANSASYRCAIARREKHRSQTGHAIPGNRLAGVERRSR